MVKSQLETSIIKYLLNEASTNDLHSLSEWIKQPGSEQIFEDYIRSHYEITTAMNQPDIERLKANLLRGIRNQKKQNYFRMVRSTIKYAAIGLLFLGVGYFYQQGYFVESDAALTPKNDPVLLQMSDGTVKQLDVNKTEKVQNVKGQLLGNKNKSQLTYVHLPETKELVYNTLTVPFGKRFEIVLSDGTYVFLNSGTSLRYPVNFVEGKNRKVFLQGEAYFDVSKNELDPFVVNINDFDVEVLGTQFNISAHTEDPTIDVVLVEGSVSIADNKHHSDESTLLSPGQKGSFNHLSKQVNVANVNTSIYTSWMQGHLVFRALSFNQILIKMERHYNVEIVNTNMKLGEEVYNASFDNVTIEQVLNFFSDTHEIAYNIDNNTVIIE
jgi:transmembrane sensor